MFKRTTLFLFVSFLLASSLFAQTTTVWTLTFAPYGVSPRDVAKSTTDIYDFASTGLSNVGVGSKVYLITQLASPSIPKAKFASTTSAVWTFTSRPSGSTAAISATRDFVNDSTRVVFFTPDKIGMYKIKVAEGVYSQEITINAAKYLGYQTPASNGLTCTTCHNSTLDPIVTNWSKTKHATMFTRAMNGTVSSNYSKNCISCHTTGFDANPTAINDGFDDLTFTFPTVLGAGGFDKLVTAFPDAMKRANIQCESCHGPSSGHAGVQSDSRIQATYANEVCAYCHDSGTKHFFPEQIKASRHAFPTRTPSGAGRENCVKCHTAVGFAQYASGVPTTDPYFSTAYVPITCAGCHDPHDTKNQYQLRKINVSLLGQNGVYDEIKTAGTGALCMNCHQSRREYNAQIASNGYSSLNPHYGAQGDVLYGRNMVEMGGIKLQSTGHSWLENTCVKCHMYSVNTVSDAQGKIVQMGGHSFNMQSYKKDASGNFLRDAAGARISESDNVEACAPCHGSTFGSFDQVKFFYNGQGDLDNNGVTEGMQAEIKGMIAKIYDKMPKTAAGAVATPSATWKKEQLQGYWNAKTAEYDNSGGIHNPKYIVTALRGAMIALGIPTAVEDEQVMPTEYVVYQNYPNPFNPTTNIKFALPASGHVKLTIYDAVGREVATLVNNELSAGTHNIEWKANNMASGVYLYRIEAGNYVKVNKMLLVK